VLWGAATGAVGGVVAPVVGKVLSVVAPKVVGAVTKLFGASKAGSSSATAATGKTVAGDLAHACSFAGATVVLMADGSEKPIDQVAVGDTVLASDAETGEQKAEPVQKVFVHTDTLVDLVVDGATITTTKNHPFWSVTDQTFERADQLSAGERVLSADGAVLRVDGIPAGSARLGFAYNLSIDEIHTYHVGAAQVLVHNTCGVNLASDARTDHILNGEVRPNGSFGGGHRAGTGFPKKSEFPSSWSDARIMHYVSDVATDPGSARTLGGTIVEGSRGGIDIRVVLRNDEIWTAFPTNVTPNP
jgi:hypothetical protein